jgi:hypothetical protein
MENEEIREKFSSIESWQEMCDKRNNPFGGGSDA